MLVASCITSQATLFYKINCVTMNAIVDCESVSVSLKHLLAVRTIAITYTYKHDFAIKIKSH